MVVANHARNALDPQRVAPFGVPYAVTEGFVGRAIFINKNRIGRVRRAGGVLFRRNVDRVIVTGKVCAEAAVGDAQERPPAGAGAVGFTERPRDREISAVNGLHRPCCAIACAAGVRETVIRAAVGVLQVAAGVHKGVGQVRPRHGAHGLRRRCTIDFRHGRAFVGVLQVQFPGLLAARHLGRLGAEDSLNGKTGRRDGQRDNQRRNAERFGQLRGARPRMRKAPMPVQPQQVRHNGAQQQEALPSSFSIRWFHRLESANRCEFGCGGGESLSQPNFFFIDYHFSLYTITLRDYSERVVSC